MTKTERVTRDDGAIRVIDSVEDAEQSALEAVRKFWTLSTGSSQRSMRTDRAARSSIRRSR